jgi:hypothetical protein
MAESPKNSALAEFFNNLLASLSAKTSAPGSRSGIVASLALTAIVTSRHDIPNIDQNCRVRHGWNISAQIE